MTGDCIFCKIATGDMDAYRVHDDADTVAFLDINPVSEGHTLVIPKAHAKTLTGLDDAETKALFGTVRELAERIDEQLNPGGVNLLQNNGTAAGQEVGHVHVHIIPRYGARDGFDFSFDQRSLEEAEAEKLRSQLVR